MTTTTSPRTSPAGCRRCCFRPRRSRCLDASARRDANTSKLRPPAVNRRQPRPTCRHRRPKFDRTVQPRPGCRTAPSSAASALRRSLCRRRWWRARRTVQRQTIVRRRRRGDGNATRRRRSPPDRRTFTTCRTSTTTATTAVDGRRRRTPTTTTERRYPSSALPSRHRQRRWAISASCGLRRPRTTSWSVGNRKTPRFYQRRRVTAVDVSRRSRRRHNTAGTLPGWSDTCGVTWSCTERDVTPRVDWRKLQSLMKSRLYSQRHVHGMEVSSCHIHFVGLLVEKATYVLIANKRRIVYRL